MAKPQATASILNDPRDDVERCLSDACCLIATTGKPNSNRADQMGKAVICATRNEVTSNLRIPCRPQTPEESGQLPRDFVYHTSYNFQTMNNAHAGNTLVFNAEGPRLREVRVTSGTVLAERQIDQHAVRIPNNKA
jgi:hypothetical protein